MAVGEAMDRAIVALAWKFYGGLPPHAKQWISLEDLVQLAEQAIAARYAGFDPARGASEGTWRYMVARSCFLDLSRRMKRQVATAPEVDVAHVRASYFPEELTVGAGKRVQSFLRCASPGLHDALCDYFTGGGELRRKAPRYSRYSDFREEARLLRRTTGAGPEDFRSVLRSCYA
jgi:DNA-directed RNA polymerase specialized sigma24 family protein